MRPELGTSVPRISAWHQPMVPIALIFGLGIAADRWFWDDTTPPRLWLYYLLAGLLVLALSRFAARASRTGVSLFLLLFSVLFAGAARHHMHWRLFAENDIGRFASDQSQPICAEVILLSVLERSAISADLMTFPEPQPFLRGIARAVALRDGKTWRNVSGRILLSVAGTESPYRPGDRLRIIGKLVRPPSPRNPGEFNLREYRRADRILAQVVVEYPEGITLVSSGAWWDPVVLLGRWRIAARLRLHRFLPESDHALAQSLLLGFRKEIPEEFEEALLKTGTIHILAISGLHVGILAGGFETALRLLRLPRRLRIPILLAVTILYLALAGGQPSTIRASVVLGVFLIGYLMHRPTFSMNTLAVAAMVLLILNPSDLFRPGPQLSFLAASVLVVVTSSARLPSEKLLDFSLQSQSSWNRSLRRVLRNRLLPLILLSVAIWLVTLPLVLNQFHILNPLGVVLTPILVPLITVAILTGFILVFTAPVIGVGAAPLAWLCHISLSIVETVITFTCRFLPLYCWLPSPGPIWVSGFYSLWIIFLIWGWRGPFWLMRPILLALTAWFLGGILTLVFPRSANPNEFRLTLLSVGHGLASVLELPNGEVWVYDVGSFGNGRIPARALAGYLWSRGVTRIDALILSHADLDHFNGLPQVLDYFRVKKVLVSPKMFQHSEPGVDELRRLLNQSQIPCQVVSSGQRWGGEGYNLEVIHPPSNFTSRNDNAQSVVILVDYAGRRLLLPGDLEGEGTQAILRTSPVSVDVLVAPHHGSLRGQAGDLINWCRPHWLLVSGGESSRASVIEHFQDKVLHVLHVAETGAITLVFSPNGYEIKMWRSLQMIRNAPSQRQTPGKSP
ncbi:MAG: DNA internalization-related competence protein ComEC/Rec2 [Thermogutta sp.]